MSAQDWVSCGAPKLPSSQKVTKVQLPGMYLRNLDKRPYWDILGLGEARRRVVFARAKERGGVLRIYDE